ncbi:MAG TPA: ABC transporter permease subunit [Rectinemataceae bacterium]|nr:ABC transporter permease subunit [Rectinemataceae bacterium]
MSSLSFAASGSSRALRTALSLAAAFAAAIVLAGAPLAVTNVSGHPLFTPGRIVTAFAAWVAGLHDGSSFVYFHGTVSWRLFDLAPSYIFVSFVNIALPGSVAIFLGIFVGLSFRAAHRNILDRVLLFVASTPDFLVAMSLQALALLLVPLGLHIRIGPSRAGFSPLAFLVMGIYPFVAAFRATAFAARQVAKEEWVAAARSRGLPESAIRRRHIGAAVLLSLRSELPVLIGAMQGTLFIVEYQFSLPGLARFLFETAFSGRHAGYFYLYQYNLGLFALLSLVIVCAAVQALFSLTLNLARRAMADE